jgi:protoporphyrinogen oxidase
MYIDTIILGAGIAGLAYAAYAKERKNENVVVFEAEDRPGGLCRSFKIETSLGSFTFDSAVHLSFTANPDVRILFDRTPYIRHEPLAYNFYSRRWLKHPVINNLYPLTVSEKVRFIKSFVERNEFGGTENYGKWLCASYGEEISRCFHYVYTKKYWTHEPEELTTSWIGRRLNTPDIEKILYGAFSEVTENDYYAEEMRYPAGNGGYETFLKPLIENIPEGIVYNKMAVKIEIKEREIKFKDGSKYNFRKLVSSIPLPNMVAAIEGAPGQIKDSASRLRATKVSLVSVGFKKPNNAKRLWFYIYDEDIMAARVYAPGVKSPGNVPSGCSSLQFEIYHGQNEKIDKNEIIANTVYALRKMNLCASEEDILFIDYRLMPYGNVVFLHGMEKHRDRIRSWLDACGVDTIGRFGEWDYLWSDQSYLSGKRLALVNECQ